MIHNSGKEEPKEGRQGHQEEIPAAALNRMMVMVTMPSLSLSFHAGRVTFRALVCGDLRMLRMPHIICILFIYTGGMHFVVTNSVT